MLYERHDLPFYEAFLIHGSTMEHGFFLLILFSGHALSKDVIIAELILLENVH